MWGLVLLAACLPCSSAFCVLTSSSTSFAASEIGSLTRPQALCPLSALEGPDPRTHHSVGLRLRKLEMSSQGRRGESRGEESRRTLGLRAAGVTTEGIRSSETEESRIHGLEKLVTQELKDDGLAGSDPLALSPWLSSLTSGRVEQLGTRGMRIVGCDELGSSGNGDLGSGRVEDLGAEALGVQGDAELGELQRDFEVLLAQHRANAAWMRFLRSVARRERED